jgi:hypothetical protein
MRFKSLHALVFIGLIGFLSSCANAPVNNSKSCQSVDECLDVQNNNYTISSQAYSIWAEGEHLPSRSSWYLTLTKQHNVSFVRCYIRGQTPEDDDFWEQRIEEDGEFSTVTDPMQFSERITRICENQHCVNREESL